MPFQPASRRARLLSRSPLALALLTLVAPLAQAAGTDPATDPAEPTDLDKVQVGDTFTFEVFGEVLTYRVFDKKVVNPEETEALRSEPRLKLAESAAQAIGEAQKLLGTRRKFSISGGGL